MSDGRFSNWPGSRYFAPLGAGPTPGPWWTNWLRIVGGFARDVASRLTVEAIKYYLTSSDNQLQAA